MMPDNQALQTFYGTLPLILVIAAGFFRSNVLLKDILSRLARVEGGLTEVRNALGKVKERLVVLETRAGIIYHP